jgi:peptide/nickel transport system permease protein
MSRSSAVLDRHLNDEQRAWLYEYVELHFVTPFRIIWSDWRGRFGVCILFAYLVMGTLGVMLVAPPSYAAGPRALLPFQNWEYPLGTNNSGRPLFAQIVHATPPMLKMVAAGAIFTVLIATVVGLTAGYKGGRLDRGLMTISDIVMTLPGLPLIIVISAIFKPQDAIVIGIILSINDWAGLARQIRSEVLSLREESYVEASRALGINIPTILRMDILPNLMPFVSVRFMTAARRVIFGAVGLYFLGLLPFSKHNWGTLLDAAYKSGAMWHLESSYKFFVPLMTILLFSLSLILLTQSLDAMFNPRIRARRSSTVESEGEEMLQG